MTITVAEERKALGPGDKALPGFKVHEGPVPPDQGDIGRMLGEEALAEIRQLDAAFKAPSYSGLSEAHRKVAKHVVSSYCHALLRNPSQVHYTQNAVLRWYGINHRVNLRSVNPYWGDCSSTATFILWRALTHVHRNASDIVNGAHWLAGYTGTIAGHGKHVVHDENIRVGDLILYGSAPTYEHVVVSLGGKLCFSHGGEAGPFVLNIDYRGDRMMTRRII